MEIFYADLGPFCVVSLPPTVFTSNRSDPQASFRSALALHSLIVALSLSYCSAPSGKLIIISIPYAINIILKQI